MASVDLRLSPLLAVLEVSGFSWLAAEALELVERGDAPLATDGAVRTWRENAARGGGGEDVYTGEELGDEVGDVAPLEGAEQLDAVVAHVVARLSDTLEMIEGAVGSLDIVRGRQGDALVSPAEPPVGMIVRGELITVGRRQLSEARKSMQVLSAALENWRNSAQGSA